MIDYQAISPANLTAPQSGSTGTSGAATTAFVDVFPAFNVVAEGGGSGTGRSEFMPTSPGESDFTTASVGGPAFVAGQNDPTDSLLASDAMLVETTLGEASPAVPVAKGAAWQQGPASDDVLIGGDGSDLLIGGDGRGTLVGGIARDSAEGTAEVRNAAVPGWFDDMTEALAAAMNDGVARDLSDLDEFWADWAEVDGDGIADAIASIGTPAFRAATWRCGSPTAPRTTPN